MFLLLSVSMVSPALSFNTGAPQAACQTLAPDATQHGAQSQVSEVPYILNLSAFYNSELNRMIYTPDTVYNGRIYTRLPQCHVHKNSSLYTIVKVS